MTGPAGFSGLAPNPTKAGGLWKPAFSGSLMEADIDLTGLRFTIKS
ncbi:hypothetical protein HLH36_00775 [Gluconacetobacter aggeris]|uniref:Uncharacterized protein n=1 Tax=Gluconacetobacter aggeris TaxID=1286186 RepID=A0A7W4NUT1_9PROT|nr:hypothetical protein [Gluconacetobacter aggeris]MBB2166902.1 hypothetical protein [Gluconacetobacter aggeris]